MSARGRVKEDVEEFYGPNVNLSSLPFTLPDVPSGFMNGVSIDENRITQSVRKRAVKLSRDSGLLVGRRRNISSEFDHADDSESK